MTPVTKWIEGSNPIFKYSKIEQLFLFISPNIKENGTKGGFFSLRDDLVLFFFISVFMVTY